jgi:hypothetical protein
MSMSRRRFIKGIAAFSGTALIPAVDGAPLRSLSVGAAIQYLCDDVFASPAEKAARVVPPMRHPFTV